ncbi:gag/pol polyprotein [Gossypium australe]|uniref:Gag/pol polyprotein n=1 Tax=Gossypium australe TaxID=47621 RepID=A0A5B6W9R9_9ROSI|nr:gag/pol polyprotein [Gossypium australe]
MLKEKRDRFGLGFRPDAKQRKKEIDDIPSHIPDFCIRGIIHPERELLENENLHINAITRKKLGKETCWAFALMNLEASLNINDMSNDITNSEVHFEQDMCLEEFKGDRDCDLSPELLRMVKQEEKQILPHEEVVENIVLEEGKVVKIGTRIVEEMKQDLVELLQKFKDVSAWSYQDMPGLSTDIVVHRLSIGKECKPVQQKLRRIRPDVVLKIKEEVKKQFDAGFLQVANIVLFPKNDGKVRMCVDYRDLNKANPKDNFLLTHIGTLVDNTAGNSLFSFMNGFLGYNQIKMHPEDMEKTTFITLWGTFFYKVMPFGIKNAGATYQRAMVTLFYDMMHKEIEIYVDDMIAKSRTEKEHIEVLKKFFLRLRKLQLKLNPAKCTFGARSGKLLGFVVSERGIKVNSNKVKAIQELPPPRTQKEVRGFLKCDPIFRLLKKQNQGVWDDEYQKAFDKVKQYMSNASVLSPPNLDRPLILYLIVFNNSMGCVLGQHDESGRKEKPIYYLSKKFTKCEMRYSSIEKLCCALIWKTRRLRQYMLYYTTWLISKLDPLKYMMESTALNGRMARALEDYEPLSFDFPNEELMHVATTEECPWKLNFDGGQMLAILVSPSGDHYPFTCKLDFDCTNNMAEYEACIMRIRAVVERKIRVLEVYEDPALGNGRQDAKLIDYQKIVLGLIEEFDDITFNYLPRDENRMADALATLASMIKVNKSEDMKPIQMSIFEVLAHYYNMEEEEKDDHPWYHDVLQYVKNREYPEHATENDKTTLRRLASDYVLDGDILYKRRKARKILEEVHEGVCGTLANGFTMARKIMRFGYYWSTMEGDCIKYAKRCHLWRQDSRTTSPLHVMTSPWPFSMWGMDVIGSISPKALNGHQFILVVIDYIMKWVEAASYVSVTKTTVNRFLKK